MSLKLSMHVKWLMSEIDTWLRDGIIDEKQAVALRGRYPAPEERNWGMIVLTSVGSVIFGLGLILIIAYNWEKMGRYVKLLLIFASMLAAHAAGYHFTREESSRKGLGEGVSLLGTMLFGAAIWLIAQVYHIDEHYPNGLLAWGVGAWAMAWAMPSIAQCILAAVILAFWGGFEAHDFRNVFHLAPVFIILCTVPLAWVKKSRVLLAVGVIAALAALISNALSIHERVAAPVILLAAAVIIMAGHLLSSSESFPESSAVMTILGFVPYALMLYLLSFPKLGSALLQFGRHGGVEYFILLCVAAGVMTALALTVWYLRDKRFTAAILVDSAGVLASIAVLVFKFAEGIRIERLIAERTASHPDASLQPVYLRFEGWGLAGIFNLILLAYCITLIWDGVRNLNSKKTAAGVALFALLAFTRYADLFEDLVVRGLVFLAVGGAIFAVGAFYNRFKKAQEVRS